MLMINGTPAGTLGRPNPRGLMGTADITALQQALLNLAVTANRPSSNPGPVTGVVNDATMAAIGASAGVLTEQLPSWLYLAFQVAMIAGAGTTTAKKFVEDHAAEFTIAINTATAKMKSTGIIPPYILPTTTPGLFDTLFPIGWYTTPSLGWLVVGALGFGAYKLLKKPESSTTKAA